jgi:hypothetical protein
MTASMRKVGIGVFIFLVTLIATISLAPLITEAGSSWLETNSVALNTILLVVFALGFLGMVGILIYQQFFYGPSRGGRRAHQASNLALALGMLLLGGVTAADVFGVVLPKGQILFGGGVALLAVGSLILLWTLRRT